MRTRVLMLGVLILGVLILGVLILGDELPGTRPRRFVGPKALRMVVVQMVVEDRTAVDRTVVAFPVLGSDADQKGSRQDLHGPIPTGSQVYAVLTQ